MVHSSSTESQLFQVEVDRSYRCASQWCSCENFPMALRFLVRCAIGRLPSAHVSCYQDIIFLFLHPCIVNYLCCHQFCCASYFLLNLPQCKVLMVKSSIYSIIHHHRGHIIHIFPPLSYIRKKNGFADLNQQNFSTREFVHKIPSSC